MKSEERFLFALFYFKQYLRSNESSQMSCYHLCCMLSIGLFISLLSPDIINAQRIVEPLLKPQFSHEVRRALDTGSLSEPSAAYKFVDIGLYSEAITTYDIPLAWGLETINYEDSIDLLSYTPVEALPYISQIAEKEKIIIISEAHHKPQHRIFTRLLLSALRQRGFNTLGLEALTPDPNYVIHDTALYSRRYPLRTLQTGTYTREPQMGNLVRDALELGFNIFAYEKSPESSNERDLQQALNIQAYLHEYPDARIVIHCGWYHAIESAFPKRRNDKYMAYHLKHLTGIDPLSIYQDALSERLLLPESPYYRMVNSDQISVLVNAAGQIWNGVDTTAHFDIQIYHPPTELIHGRPMWLFLIEGNQPVAVRKDMIPEKDYPVIIQAFGANEPDEATPSDVIEIASTDDQGTLVLRPGAYRVVIDSSSGNRIEYVQTVK